VRLAEVDDGDALAMIENEWLRARIPAFGLVTEVYAGIEEVFRSDVHGIYVSATHRPANGPPCDRELSYRLMVLTDRAVEDRERAEGWQARIWQVDHPIDNRHLG
jgi:hypothetical protein